MDNLKEFISIITKPIWKLLFGGPPFIYGWFALIRDECLPAHIAEKWRIGGFMSGIAWFWFVIFGSLIWGLWTAFEAAIRINAIRKKSSNGLHSFSGVVDMKNSHNITFINSPITKQINKITFTKKSKLAGPIIRKKVIRLIDLVNPKSLEIRNKTFENCEIYGPAIVFIGANNSFISCGFDIPIPSFYFWEINLDGLAKIIVGVIGINECKFKDCNFHMIGFAGDSNLHDTFRKLESGDDFKEKDESNKK